MYGVTLLNILLIFKNYRSEGYYLYYRWLMCPTEAVLKKQFGGTIKGP